jgi:hypothetical protein
VSEPDQTEHGHPPLMYVRHTHQIRRNAHTEVIIGEETHAHPLNEDHPGNWTNLTHRGVDTESWDADG